ncbi:MAG: ATP-binding cassette domain-containing protein [Gammaproteobacteria bacterium]|nr:ATP-binding cassette domain-containing protein [Gammaproteobacteria bacterium]
MRAPTTILPLTLENVTFAPDGRAIVAAISCEIPAGDRTIIVGPNGAGKSVLMRLCHGLLQPTSGRVVWRGATGNAVHRRQAMVFQRPIMLRRSAIANIEYALALQGIARDERSLLCAPRPRPPPFVRPGDLITSGDPIALLEVMKTLTASTTPVPRTSPPHHPG